MNVVRIFYLYFLHLFFSSFWQKLHFSYFSFRESKGCLGINFYVVLEIKLDTWTIHQPMSHLSLYYKSLTVITEIMGNNSTCFKYFNSEKHWVVYQGKWTLAKVKRKTSKVSMKLLIIAMSWFLLFKSLVHYLLLLLGKLDFISVIWILFDIQIQSHDIHINGADWP